MKNKTGIKRVIIIIILSLILTLISLVIVYFVKKENTNKTKLQEVVNKRFTFLIEEDNTILNNIDEFKEQKKKMDDILTEYKKGNFNIDNPLLYIDPFNCSPQTALLLFKTKNKENITLTIKGKHGDDLIRKFASSTDHIIPVYGLYGKYNNQVIIETESGSKKTIEINIEKEFAQPKMDVLKNEVKNSNGEFYFATSSLGASSIAYDNYGEVRWGLNRGYTKGMTMLQNGHILLSNDKTGPNVTSTSGIVEIDMLGYIIHEYEISGGYHHDAYELENGNLIVLTTNENNKTIADYVVELDRKTGNIVKSWNLNEIVSKIDANLIKDNQITWGTVSSITYDQKNDALIMSLKNLNSIISIGYTTSNINWILGESRFWSSKFEPYLIKGVKDEFIYPLGAHSVNVLSDGSISIFNNGYDAYLEEEVPCNTLKNNSSYAVIYQIDVNSHEASISYKFGGNEYFSYTLSSYTPSTNNHFIFNSGWHFNNKVNFEDNSCTQFSNDLYDSYIIDFDEQKNETVKLHIDESKFEVIKADIYNLENVSVKPKSVNIIDNYQTTRGVFTSTIKPDEPEILSESDALKYQTNETNFITFSLINKRLKLLGNIPDNMEFKVTLITGNGKAYRYTLKSKDKEKKEYIDISSLESGRYYIYVNLDNYIYNTTQYIDIE